eukprot:scaffold140323_cov41-Prasinocladus_malaysianus.AAC.2
MGRKGMEWNGLGWIGVEFMVWPGIKQILKWKSIYEGIGVPWVAVLKPHASVIAKRLLASIAFDGDSEADSAGALEGEKGAAVARLLRLLDTRAPEELDVAINKALGAQAKATRKALRAAAREAKQTGRQTDAGKKAEARLQKNTEFLQ